MPARVRTVDAGAESSRRSLATLCHELRLARLDRNLAEESTTQSSPD
jgi:hypothetical protein